MLQGGPPRHRTPGGHVHHGSGVRAGQLLPELGQAGGPAGGVQAVHGLAHVPLQTDTGEGSAASAALARRENLKHFAVGTPELQRQLFHCNNLQSTVVNYL